MIEAVASAKVNLSLRVGAATPSGLHRVRGIFQSVSWFDRLAVDWAEADTLGSTTGGEVVAGTDNLAWRALLAVRQSAETDRAVGLTLDKAIPAAAGLGGGSADAAAALGVGGRLFGVTPDRLAEIAETLGSDVPFCFSGGMAEVAGVGEIVTERDVASGYVLGLVTPPVELATPDVFATWDELGGPTGPAIAGADLPPALRGDSPLVNDLFPAAALLAPAIDDWRAELSARWGRPAMMTGSGPTLFGFFVDQAEAVAAISSIPAGARAATAAAPIEFGWAARDGVELWSARPIGPERAADIGEFLRGEI